MDGKHNCLGNFEKIFKNLFSKYQQMLYFSLVSKYFQNSALNFRAFWRKTQLFGEVLRKLSKVSRENSKKFISLAYSQLNSQNEVFFFARLDEKYKLFGNFEKSLKFFGKKKLEKLNFYLFLERLSLKIEPSEIPSFFDNNFSISGVRNAPYVPLGCGYPIKFASRNFMILN